MSTGTYVGVPDIYALDMAARTVREAFESYGLFLVGSALERHDWRDIDLRMIMADDVFMGLFPGAMIEGGRYAHHPRWILLTTTISEHMRKVTGLPIDFQIQPESDANARHKKRRHALGMRVDEPVGKEMTVAEIEAALGHKVKVVK